MSSSLPCRTEHTSWGAPWPSSNGLESSTPRSLASARRETKDQRLGFRVLRTPGPLSGRITSGVAVTGRNHNPALALGEAALHDG